MSFKMPSIKDVASVLKGDKRSIGDEMVDEEGNVGFDVRLQVHENGRWSVHTGDSQYDQDHRGFWGSGFLSRSTNCRELAADLIDQCADHAAQCEPVNGGEG